MTFIYIGIFFLITALGAVTGIGGGVILKPVMDALGHFSAAEISVICAAVVFSMAAVSCVKQSSSFKNVNNPWHYVFLSAGAVGGGALGRVLLGVLAEAAGTVAALIQNIALAAVLAAVVVYMLFTEKIPKLKLKLNIWYGAAGLFLGGVSAFLGIGGGPLNIAVLMLLFSMDIKSAGFASIITILFSQAANLVTAAVGGFLGLRLSSLPYFIIAAVIGGLLGSVLKKHLSQTTVKILLNLITLCVIAVCFLNISAYFFNKT